MFKSAVMATKTSISEQKSELKRLELEAKDQNVMMIQYFGHMKNQLEKFTVRHQRGRINFLFNGNKFIRDITDC